VTRPARWVHSSPHRHEEARAVILGHRRWDHLFARVCRRDHPPERPVMCGRDYDDPSRIEPEETPNHMTRTYTLTLDIEGPDDTDTDLLDSSVESVVEWSTAREAIDAGLFHVHTLDVAVTSLRVAPREPVA
jgi:hypothetical protein